MSAQSDRFRVLRRLTEIRFEDELRGYSKNQVDRVLETLVPLAADVDDLQAKLADAERRADSAESALTDRGDSLISPQVAPAPVAAPIPAVVVETSVDAPSTDFDETLRKTLMLAQQTADTVVREASEEAERVRTSARNEADELLAISRSEAAQSRSEGEAAKTKMVADVASERGSLLRAAQDSAKSQIAAIEAELVSVHESQRSELVQQIAELQQIRDLLADDIENFEAYLADRRLVVRAAMSEINVVLDDPARIRPSIPPQPTEVAPVDPKVLEPISIELSTLGELNVDDAAFPDDLIDSAMPVASSEEVPSSDEKSSPENSPVESDEISPDDISRGGVSDVDGPKPAGAGSLFGLSPESHEAATTEVDSDAALLDALSGHDDATVEVESLVSDTTIEASDDVAPRPDAVGPATEAVPVVASEDDDSMSAAATNGATSDAATRVHDDAEPAESQAVSITDPWSDSGEALAGDTVTPETSTPVDDDVERPAWADSVPDVPGEADSSDPFLDELRKATSDQAAEDGALSRFLNDDEENKDSSRGGWFGRRR